MARFDLLCPGEGSEKSIRLPGLPAVVVDLDDCIGLVQLRQRRAVALVCGRCIATRSL